MKLKAGKPRIRKGSPQRSSLQKKKEDQPANNPEENGSCNARDRARKNGILCRKGGAISKRASEKEGDARVRMGGFRKKKHPLVFQEGGNNLLHPGNQEDQKNGGILRFKKGRGDAIL